MSTAIGHERIMTASREATKAHERYMQADWRDEDRCRMLRLEANEAGAYFRYVYAVAKGFDWLHARMDWQHHRRLAWGV